MNLPVAGTAFWAILCPWIARREPTLASGRMGWSAKSLSCWVERPRTALRGLPLLVCVAGFHSIGVAQELEPRSYVNIPVGLNFLILGVGHTEGLSPPVPTCRWKMPSFGRDALALGYARSFALAGNSAKFDVQTARACYKGRADVAGEPVSASRCEWADTKFRLSWNFIGGSAFTPAEYRERFKPGLTVGASLQVEMPTGSYRSDRVLNAGTNRWMVRPGIGMSYLWQGWYFDISTEAKFFTDNDDYLGSRISQDPMYQVQKAHWPTTSRAGRMDFLEQQLLSGRESSRDGSSLGDELDNSRLGVTVSFPIAAGHSLRLNASKGVVTRLGTDFDTIGITYQYRF